MYQIGSIIIVENQIFDLGKNNRKTQIDHSNKRPALIISEDEDCFYYITLTSKQGNGCVGYYTNETIMPNGTVQCHKEKKMQFVQVRHIYSKKIYGALELTRISDNDLLNILVLLYQFHESRKYTNFDKVEKNILQTIKSLSVKLNKTNEQK